MPSPSRQFRAGAVAGIASAAAYAAEQELDLRCFRHNTDDFILLGRLVTSSEGSMCRVGLGMHLLNGAAVGGAYALIVHDRIPGPPIARSLAFLMVETAALYPLALLEDYHPGIREGRLASYWNRTGLVQQVLRHVAFGAVLGPLTARLLDGVR